MNITCWDVRKAIIVFIHLYMRGNIVIDSFVTDQINILKIKCLYVEYFCTFHDHPD